MTTKTPIAVEDIRPGDKVRSECGDTATEWRVGHTWSTPKRWDIRYFLLDRPKKIVYKAGTTLYRRTDGLSVMLSRDHIEGDPRLYVEPFNGARLASHYTDVKPRTLKWAKGTRLWFKDNADNRAVGCTGSLALAHDVHEGDRYVEGAYYVSRFTDVKPDPHPVGAIRWVMEDCKTRWGVPLTRGQRVEIEHNSCNNTPLGHVCVSFPGHTLRFLDSKFLSATKVEPAPQTVTVPRDAVEKLRGEEQFALNLSPKFVQRKNDIRRDAISDFLCALDGHV